MKWLNIVKSPKKKQAEQINIEPVDHSEDEVNFSDNSAAFWTAISPEGLKIESDDYGIIKQTLSTETHFRSFYFPRDGFPRKLQTNFLSPLLTSGEIDIMIRGQKIPKAQTVRMLQRQITMLESNLSFQTKRGNTDQVFDLKTKIADCEQLISEVQFNENDLFNVSVTGTMYAPSKRELDRYVETMEDEMGSIFIKLTSTWSRMKKGFRSALPFTKNEIMDSYRNIDRRAFSTFSPFISGSGRYYGGVPIGINKITGQKEFLNSFGNNKFRPNNYNIAIFGEAGSGKSLTVKLKIAREMAAGDVYAAVLDVEGEYAKLTKRLGGINLNISEESNIIINPLSIFYSEIELDEEDEELEMLERNDEKQIFMKDGKKYVRFVPIKEKISEVLGFFDTITRGKDGNEPPLNIFERNYIEEAMNWIFAEKLKITTNPDSLFEEDIKEVHGEIIQSKVQKPEPTISDVYDYLNEKYGKEVKAERLLANIIPFLRTGSKPIFDGQTNLGKNQSNQALLESRLINFNLKNMEEGYLKPVAYQVILNFLWEHFVKSPRNATKKKYLYADEAWQFINNDTTVSFMEKVARRIRKRHGGFVIASQDFIRFIENEKARAVVQNSYTQMFFKQNKIDKNHIRENFDLSEGEINILFGEPEPGEGILRIGKNSIWLKTDPSEEDMIFLESNQAVLEEYMKRRRIPS